MKKIVRKLIFILTAVLIFNSAGVSALRADLPSVINGTADFLVSAVLQPQYGSIGGEWTVFALARSGAPVPNGYYEGYRSSLAAYLKKCGGILDERKNTEYSRTIIALTAIGENPRDFAGFNLLLPLADYKKTTLQGLNGAVWALIALDCGGYAVEQSSGAEVQATRELYIEKILAGQNDSGGWSFGGNADDSSDTDMTAMALQALAKYRTSADVGAAVEKALGCLAAMQLEDGGFPGMKSESCAQVITALCELEIPLTDARFVKNGCTVLDKLLSYRTAQGGFCHAYGDDAPNLMATEQALYALAAVRLSEEGRGRLYDMADSAVSLTQNEGSGAAVSVPPVTMPQKTFSDTFGLECEAAVASLAERGIVNGMTDNAFVPNGSVTRAEFAAIIVRALGLRCNAEKIFADVSESDWFFESVCTAFKHKIINGVSEAEFNPHGNITREEAAVMLMRAASLCSADTNVPSARDILCVFTDYTAISTWAADGCAFCCDAGIISDEDSEFSPHRAALRGETAQFVYNLLKSASLIGE